MNQNLLFIPRDKNYIMKAVQILGDISSPRIVTNNSMTEPKPHNSDILIRVHAAGITGDEVLWPEVYNCPTRIPGHDISGVISAFGPDYSNGNDRPLRIGQEVFALITAGQGEGQAEYVICRPNEVAPKPASISHSEAAALPIPLLTAWEAIFDHGRVKAGTRVLITGASGAVGRLSVQIAAQLGGAYVIALASARHHDMLRQLGACEVLDYNTTGWEYRATNVDLVFDTVGQDVLAKAWETVKKNDGKIVTVGDPPPSWAFGKGQAAESVNWPNVQYVHFIVSSNAERLSKASKMIDAGSIKPLEVQSFPFLEAEHAWSLARQRHRGHKVVIDFVGAAESST